MFLKVVFLESCRINFVDVGLRCGELGK
jgi:hypothetical protein